MTSAERTGYPNSDKRDGVAWIFLLTEGGQNPDNFTDIIYGCPLIFHSHSISYTFGLLHIWRVGSTYLTVSVTVERYVAICHPLMKRVRQTYLVSKDFSLGLIHLI